MPEPKKRAPLSNAERSRRFKARKRGELPPVTKRGAVAAVAPLSAAALLAEKEALAVLGSDADRFAAAVRMYVLAVDVADHARAVWEGEGRPMRDSFANGMAGISPYLNAMQSAAAQAMRFAGELGLTPASAKRISGVRGAGRPMGSASAADRKAERPGMRLAALPEPLAIRVNRARGHVED